MIAGGFEEPCLHAPSARRDGRLSGNALVWPLSLPDSRLQDEGLLL